MIETQNNNCINSGTEYLGEVSSNSGMIELTLSYPRTAAFKKMSWDEQKILYGLHLNCILNEVKIVGDCSSFIEASRDGNLHMHASLFIKQGIPYYREGLIENVCKAYFTCLTPRYNTYRFRDFNAHFCRYKSPMIVAQYRAPDEIERVSAWGSYIRKSIPLV